MNNKNETGSSISSWIEAGAQEIENSKKVIIHNDNLKVTSFELPSSMKRQMRNNLAVNEVYHGLIGKIKGRCWWARSLGDFREGTPCEVSFDAQIVEERDEQFHDVVGFFHTHPGMDAWPSTQDVKAMRTWTISCGKPLVCCIRGADGLRAHWFIDDEQPWVTGWVMGWNGYFFGRLPKLVREHYGRKINNRY